MSSLDDDVGTDHLSGTNGDISTTLTGEEIVISGISGIFPSSDNVNKFMENLYNKVDMVVAVEPPWNLIEMPKHQGKINGLDQFDAQFFKLTFNHAKASDPMIRKLMEQAYGAVFDAGFNPVEFSESNIGVFVGSQYMDMVNVCLFESNNTNKFFLSGCSKTMLANRISYWINGKAPSYAADYSCVSSLASLEQAYQSIKSGQCDSALVGCSNIGLLPGLSVNLTRAGMLCLDGRTKCFDKNADGYVRSDTVSVILLQRAKDARRIYSEVHHAQLKYGLKQGDEFLPTRSVDDLTQFYKDFYTNINVPPEEVEYVEANGSAIAEADANEMESIGNFFGKKSPVLIGSVKSNMGNSESASGLSAVTKVCLAYHTGKLPANLHFTDPQDISSIRENRLNVVVDNVPFKRRFVAINNFSYTGIDAHVLLKGHYKPKDRKRYVSSIPYLLTISGRQEDCVEKVIKQLENEPIDPELIALWHKIHEKSTVNHMGRGYVILDTSEDGKTKSLANSVSFLSGEARPICFMYSGMGSQWSGMGAELMRIPVFRNAIMKCHKMLEPKGIDIVKVICDTDKTIFDNILNCFIGISAVQIGLTDILKELGIVPDILIGHSHGEMGCAYGDGCFTAEETILTSYSRGLTSLVTDFIPGAMAAVGLGFKDIVNLVPPEIDIACHNSSESSTISGPAEDIAKFVEVLKSRGIFAKEVQSCGISYHSRYTAVAGPRLLEGLKSIITNPKPRSDKWICTSIPQDKWGEPLSKFSSAEYHVNNLLSPVYFEEGCQLIPSNAVVIEIAPHGLLQAILNRSLPECINIPLTKRGTPDPVKFLLQAIGKIYENGYDPNVAALYPKVEFPVSTETPLLSHFVHWDYSETWPVIQSSGAKVVTTGARELVMSIHDDDYDFIKDFIRNGVNVLPESFLLFLVWETLAMSTGINYRRLPIKFNDIKFHNEVIIDPENSLKLSININRTGNRFEVSCREKNLVSGFISYYDYDQQNTSNETVTTEDLKMSSQDIYKIFHRRGHLYKNKFQSIFSMSIDSTQGSIKWTDEWPFLIDALIQFNNLAEDAKGILRPKFIQEMIIDVYKHQTCIKNVSEDNVYLNVKLDKILGVTRCGGVELKNIVFQNIPIAQLEPDIISSKEFCSHFPTSYHDLKSALNILLQVIIENSTKECLQVVELAPSPEVSLLDCIEGIINRTRPDIKFDCPQINKQHKGKNIIDGASHKTADVLVAYNLLQDKQKMMEFHNLIQSHSFLLSLENADDISYAQQKYFTIISAIRISSRIILILLKKRNDFETYGGVSCIKIDNYYKFSWLDEHHADLSSKKKVILLSVNQLNKGITGIVTSLSKKYGNRLSLVKIDDVNAPIFNQENIFYKEQLEKHLLINVLREGKWGGYYRIPSMTCKERENYALDIGCPGDISSLKWREIPSKTPSYKTVKIHYAGISLRDISKAIGKDMIYGRKFGMDFSGVDINGNRVMGLTHEGSVASIINVDSDLIWPVPDHWTLTEAATIPLAYIHAYYCLAIRAKLYKGASVIVTGGAGALGQAVISICLAYGHNVLTTVSDIEKKKLLLRLYPELRENQIFNSKDKNSASSILIHLENRRHNIIVNSESGTFRKELMACVGFMGHFLDISKEDAAENENIGMGYLFGARNYTAVNLSNIFKPENKWQRNELQFIIAEGIARGIVKPLTSVEYSTQEIPRAFKLISSRKNRGKVLINLQNPIDSSVKYSPKITCNSDKSYIVFGDRKELGLEIVHLLVQRNAKNITLHLKNKKLSGYCEFKLQSWRKQNVRLKLMFDDIASEEGYCNIFNETIQMAPIEGIFAVLDQIEENSSTVGDYSNSFTKLASGIVTLESVARDSTLNTLRYFSVISRSPQNIFEEYLNSVCEEICRTRNAVGLPGLLFNVEGLNEFSNLEVVPNSILRAQDINTLCNGLETCLTLKLSHAITSNVNSDKVESITSIEISGISHSNGIIGALARETTREKIKKYKRFERRNQDKIKQKENFNGGFGAFFNFIDDDLYRATEPIIPMSTKIVNRVPDENEIDPEGTYLMLIPGFEGHSRIFKSLCERLKIKAFTIQLDPVAKNDSIPEMAADILKLIKKRLVFKKKFYLLGYSFGINIALELTNMLEKEGQIGIVYCLDSSPDVLRKQIDSYMGTQSNVQIQNSIIKHMFSLVGKEVNKLNEHLNSKRDWDEKLEYFVQEVKQLVNYPHEYIRSLLNSVYKRIIIAHNYNPTYKLNSEIILIRGVPHPDSTPLPHDYDLSKYTNGEIKVFEIESDTTMAPFDFSVPNIINKMLDPAIIEEFSKSNSCQVYFLENSGLNF